MTILMLLLYPSITALLLYVLFNLRRTKRLPPGPTPWPIVGNLPHLGTRPHQTMAALATKHGPLVYLRLGFVDVVVAASASVAVQFLKTHDLNFPGRPLSTGGKLMAYNYQDMVFTPCGPKWRMLRKVLSVYMFSGKAMDGFRHVRQEEVAILTGSLVGAGKSPVKLVQIINVCNTNALARAIFGRRVFRDGSVGGDQMADDFKDMVVEMMVLAGEFYIGDFIPALGLLDLQGMKKKMKNNHVRFDSFLQRILEEHKSGNGGTSTHRDLLSALISHKEDADGDGRKLSDVEIKALLLNLFIAGTDTTSSTVEWAMAELIRHPELLNQAQKEMDSVVGRDRIVTELELNKLTFLQAIVKETLRLHPPTPLSLPRTASESCEVDGYYIPKGSTLLINVWAIARDPNMWTDPLEFRPTRFLPGGEKTNIDVYGNNFEFIPFGAGRRICPGINQGMRMVQLLVATLIQTFDWELANGLNPKKLNMDEAYGLTLQKAEPLMVHPKPRLAPHVYESG